MFRYIFSLTAILASLCVSAQRPGTDHDTTIKIPVTAFQPKNKTVIDTFKTGCIQSDAEAQMLIAAMETQDPEFKRWMLKHDPRTHKNSAILFVQHQFKAKDLLRSDKEAKRDEICAKYTLLQNDTHNIIKRIDELEAECDSQPESDKLEYLIYLEARLDSTLKELESLEESYSATAGQFTELDPIVSYTYHFERGPHGIMLHTDYLLGVDEIYIILVGGKTDVSCSSISTKRGETRLESDAKSIAGLVQRVSPLSAGITSFKADSLFEKRLHNEFSFVESDVFTPACPLKLEINTIAVTLLHVDQHALELPGELVLTPLGKSAITYSLHVREYLGVQAGALGGTLELRSYTFSNDTLNVSVPFEKTSTEVLPFVFLQVYPGRDINRLTPLRLRGFRFYELKNRIGLYAGLKISKKPFETITTGVSFALGPHVNLMAGIWLNRTLNVVSDYYVGPLKDEKRLDDFAPTHRPVYFSVGLSVSPSIYKDWFVSE